MDQHAGVDDDGGIIPRWTQCMTQLQLGCHEGRAEVVRKCQGRCVWIELARGLARHPFLRLVVGTRLHAACVNVNLVLRGREVAESGTTSRRNTGEQGSHPSTLDLMMDGSRLWTKDIRFEACGSESVHIFE